MTHYSFLLCLPLTISLCTVCWSEPNHQSEALMEECKETGLITKHHGEIYDNAFT